MGNAGFRSSTVATAATKHLAVPPEICSVGWFGEGRVILLRSPGHLALHQHLVVLVPRRVCMIRISDIHSLIRNPNKVGISLKSGYAYVLVGAPI